MRIGSSSPITTNAASAQNFAGWPPRCAGQATADATAATTAAPARTAA
jgi:hypothetical protein